MSLLKESISLNWSKTTIAKLKRDWPKSGMTKNQYTEQIYIKGTRYDEDTEALRAEIKRLRGEL